MTVTVNICGLDIIAEAINNLARAMGASGVTASLRQNRGSGVPAQPPAAPVNPSQPEAFANPVPGAAGPLPAAVPTAPVQQPAFPANQAGQLAPPANVAAGPASQTANMAAPTALPSQVPTTATSQGYTQDQIAVAMTGLVDQGKQPQVMQILSLFGAASLMQVPKEQYGALATQLRALGANL